MLGSLKYLELNCRISSISYNKIKVNNSFLSYKYIIFFNADKVYSLKNFLLNNDIVSVSLKNKDIKSLFDLPYFSFLNNGDFLCILIKDVSSFISTINYLNDKQFFYSYKYSLSNITFGHNVLKEYYKYNSNYVYIQFFIKKLKIKIIILFLFFLISLIKYIK